MSRPVVSAEDIRAARRRNELRLPVPRDAIVTPLAREEAARYGIDLVEEKEGASPGGPPPSRGRGQTHTATCDPDDVQRIVERVRARVPAADPAQVREIARRILEQQGA